MKLAQGRFQYLRGFPVLKNVNIYTKYINMTTARAFEIIVANETGIRFSSPDLLV
jgi:hypothetical protein